MPASPGASLTVAACNAACNGLRHERLIAERVPNLEGDAPTLHTAHTVGSQLLVKSGDN